MKDGAKNRFLDEHWPPSYKMTTGQWHKIKAAGKIKTNLRKYRQALNEIIAEYRLKQHDFCTSLSKAELDKAFRSILKKCSDLSNDLKRHPHVGAILTGIANGIEGPWLRKGSGFTPDQDIDVPEAYTQSLSGLGILALQALGFSPGSREVLYPTGSNASNPPQRSFILALLRYWKDDIGGVDKNGVNENLALINEEELRATPMTAFVHACLEVAVTLDRHGKSYDLPATRMLIRRARETPKPVKGRKNA